MRQLVATGLQQELAKASVDYIRDQLHEEIKAYCDPQFNRLAKLFAKVGYRSVSTFTLLTLIMQDILPSNLRKDLDEVQRKAKAFAITYLKSSPEEFAEIMLSEEKALEAFQKD